jgi:hypothetical protein
MISLYGIFKYFRKNKEENAVKDGEED